MEAKNKVGEGNINKNIMVVKNGGRLKIKIKWVKIGWKLAEIKVRTEEKRVEDYQKEIKSLKN